MELASHLPELQLNVQLAEHSMARLHVAVHKRKAFGDGSVFCQKLEQEYGLWALAFNWQRISECPLRGARAELRNGRPAEARVLLTHHVALFDEAATHQSCAQVQSELQHLKELRRQEAEQEDRNGASSEEMDQAYTDAFMDGLGLHRRMARPIAHGLCVVFSHRYTMLNIVELIDRGSLHAAQRATRAAPSCDKLRTAAEHERSTHALGQLIATSPSAGSSAVAPPQPLHPLLSVVCIALQRMAQHFDVRSLVMLRRTCRGCHKWQPGVPVRRTMDGDDRTVSLALQLAEVCEEQKPKLNHYLCLFEYSTNVKLYNDAIDSLLANSAEQCLQHLALAVPNGSQVLERMLVAIHAADLSALKECFAGRWGGVKLRGLPAERKLLVAACRHSHNAVELVSYLMFDVGLSPGVPDCFIGASPLHVAAESGNVRLMEMLCSDDTIGASKPMPPEGQAILNDEHDLSLIPGLSDSVGLSVLGTAVRAGQVAAVRWLIEDCDWDLEGVFEDRTRKMLLARIGESAAHNVIADIYKANGITWQWPTVA
jgi:hypothetical protein